MVNSIDSSGTTPVARAPNEDTRKRTEVKAVAGKFSQALETSKQNNKKKLRKKQLAKLQYLKRQKAKLARQQQAQASAPQRIDTTTRDHRQHTDATEARRPTKQLTGDQATPTRPDRETPSSASKRIPWNALIQHRPSGGKAPPASDAKGKDTQSDLLQISRRPEQHKARLPSDRLRLTPAPRQPETIHLNLDALTPQALEVRYNLKLQGDARLRFGRAQLRYNDAQPLSREIVVRYLPGTKGALAELFDPDAGNPLIAPAVLELKQVQAAGNNHGVAIYTPTQKITLLEQEITPAAGLPGGMHSGQGQHAAETHKPAYLIDSTGQLSFKAPTTPTEGPGAGYALPAGSPVILAGPDGMHYEVSEIDAAALEREVGRALFNNTEVRQAAVKAVERLRDVLVQLNPNASPEHIETAFFSNDFLNEGNVGTLGMPLDELLDTGSLRMVMTAFYNAAYQTKHTLGLADTLHRLLPRTDWQADAQAAGLNVEQLQRVRDFLQTEDMLWEIPPGDDQLRPIMDPEVVAATQQRSEEMGNFLDMIAGLNSLASFSTSLDRKHTPRHYEDVGAPLSAQEYAFLRQNDQLVYSAGIQEFPPEQMPLDAQGYPDIKTLQEERPDVRSAHVQYQRDAQGRIVEENGRPVVQKIWLELITLDPEDDDIINPRASDPAPGQQGPQLPLGWDTGISKAQVDPQHAWQQDAGRRGLLTYVTLSATASRMMAAMQWLRVPDPEIDRNFARALLGWMLPHQDHSQYEIFGGIEFVNDTVFQNDPDGLNFLSDIFLQTLASSTTRFTEDEQRRHQLVPDGLGGWRRVGAAVAERKDGGGDTWRVGAQGGVTRTAADGQPKPLALLPAGASVRGVVELPDHSVAIQTTDRRYYRHDDTANTWQPITYDAEGTWCALDETGRISARLAKDEQDDSWAWRPAAETPGGTDPLPKVIRDGHATLRLEGGVPLRVGDNGTVDILPGRFQGFQQLADGAPAAAFDSDGKLHLPTNDNGWTPLVQDGDTWYQLGVVHKRTQRLVTESDGTWRWQSVERAFTKPDISTPGGQRYTVENGRVYADSDPNIAQWKATPATGVKRLALGHDGRILALREDARLMPLNPETGTFGDEILAPLPAEAAEHLDSLAIGQHRKLALTREGVLWSFNADQKQWDREATKYPLRQLQARADGSITGADSKGRQFWDTGKRDVLLGLDHSRKVIQLNLAYGQQIALGRPDGKVLVDMARLIDRDTAAPGMLAAIDDNGFPYVRNGGKWQPCFNTPVQRHQLRFDGQGNQFRVGNDHRVYFAARGGAAHPLPPLPGEARPSHLFRQDGMMGVQAQNGQRYTYDLEDNTWRLYQGTLQEGSITQPTDLLTDRNGTRFQVVDKTIQRLRPENGAPVTLAPPPQDIKGLAELPNRGPLVAAAHNALYLPEDDGQWTQLRRQGNQYYGVTPHQQVIRITADGERQNLGAPPSGSEKLTLSRLNGSLELVVRGRSGILYQAAPENGRWIPMVQTSPVHWRQLPALSDGYTTNKPEDRAQFLNWLAEHYTGNVENVLTGDDVVNALDNVSGLSRESYEQRNPLYQNLSYEEYLAIQLYALDYTFAYNDQPLDVAINDALHAYHETHASGHLLPMEPFLNFLMSGLNSVPRFAGPVYSGQRTDAATINSIANDGKLSINHVLSTSVHPALSFDVTRAENGMNLRYVVTAWNGRDISAINVHEQEMILLPGDYEVGKITHHDDPNTTNYPRTTIEIRQVRPKGQPPAAATGRPLPPTLRVGNQQFTLNNDGQVIDDQGWDRGLPGGKRVLGFAQLIAPGSEQGGPLVAVTEEGFPYRYRNGEWRCPQSTVERHQSRFDDQGNQYFIESDTGITYLSVHGGAEVELPDLPGDTEPDHLFRHNGRIGVQARDGSRHVYNPTFARWEPFTHPLQEGSLQQPTDLITDRNGQRFEIEGGVIYQRGPTGGPRMALGALPSGVTGLIESPNRGPVVAVDNAGMPQLPNQAGGWDNVVAQAIARSVVRTVVARNPQLALPATLRLGLPQQVQPIMVRALAAHPELNPLFGQLVQDILANVPMPQADLAALNTTLQQLVQQRLQRPIYAPLQPVIEGVELQLELTLPTQIQRMQRILDAQQQAQERTQRLRDRNMRNRNR